MSNNSQKGFAQFLVLILVLAGLGIGVYLVQNQQIFRSRAYQEATPLEYGNQTPSNVTSTTGAVLKASDVQGDRLKVGLNLSGKVYDDLNVILTPENSREQIEQSFQKVALYKIEDDSGDTGIYQLDIPASLFVGYYFRNVQISIGVKGYFGKLMSYKLDDIASIGSVQKAADSSSQMVTFFIPTKSGSIEGNYKNVIPAGDRQIGGQYSLGISTQVQTPILNGGLNAVYEGSTKYLMDVQTDPFKQIPPDPRG